MFIIFIFIIGCIFFIGMILGARDIANNNKKLKEMDEKIEDFESKTFSTPEEREKAKQQLKKKLIKIKAEIVTYKDAKEEAGDKISIL